MLDWLKKRGAAAYHGPNAHADVARSIGAEARGRVMSGRYLLLYKYLENRYATTVVLTFAEIEDLLGFALPSPARVRREWWTVDGMDGADSNYSDSWTLANRTATPNLLAKTVVFERAPS